MKEVPDMKVSRMTISLGLAAVVSFVGLIEANASPFSMYFLADDLGNRVRSAAPEASEWDNDGGDGNSSGDSGGGDSSGDSGGGDSSGDSGGGDTAGGGDSGKSNNGHGNNEDGVDSSNPSQGKGGPNGEADKSCPEGGECIDDEASNGGSDSNGKGKKK